MCSVFLVWKRRHVSPTYTVFWQAQRILYTTHFCLSPNGSHLTIFPLAPTRGVQVLNIIAERNLVSPYSPIFDFLFWLPGILNIQATSPLYKRNNRNECNINNGVVEMDVRSDLLRIRRKSFCFGQWTNRPWCHG